MAVEPSTSTPTPPAGLAPAPHVYRGWIHDRAGRPVAGARVTPWTKAGLARRLDGTHAVLSAHDGGFEIPLEAERDLELVVEHAEHVTWRGEAPPTPAFFELRPAGRLSGHVLDARGRPAAGSRLRFETRSAGAARRELAVDEAGHFAIDGLRAEEVTLWISGPHGSLGPLVVEVEPERELRLELAPGRAIGVAVQGGDGRPVAGARVVLVHGPSGRAIDSGFTPASGRVDFPAAREDELELRIEHPRLRYEPQMLAAGPQELIAKPLPSGALRLSNPSDSELLVELSPDLATAAGPLTLVVGAGAELSCSPLAPGRWSARWSLRGDRNGRPAKPSPGSSAEVVVRADEVSHLGLDAPKPASLCGKTAWSSGEICAVELRASGSPTLLAREALEGESFAFAGLEPGSYELTLCARGGGRWRDPRTVELRAGERRELTLAPPSGSIAIQARTVDGTPLPNARAWLREGRRPLARQTRFVDGRLEEGGGHVPPAEADALGRIPLELLSSEEAVVVVEAPGHRPLELAVSSASIHVDAPLSSR